MTFLFVHALEGFSLAEWYLRHAVERSSRGVRWLGQELRPGDLESHERFRRALVSWRPDVVGFSCHFWSVEAFLEAAKWVKLLLPEAATVFGGPQVTSLSHAEFLISQYPQVDFIVRGEGEEALAALLGKDAVGRDREALRSVPRLSYREDGGAHHSMRIGSGRRGREAIFCPENRELAGRLYRVQVVSYQTLRGCVGRCSYCKSSDGKIALLDIDLVERELEYLCSFEIPHVCLCDSHFGGTADRAKRLLRTLARVNRCSSFKINPHLAQIDDEYMRLALEANAEVTCVGVQTTNPVSLRAIGRKGVRENLEGLRTLHKYYPSTPADLISGLPGDTLDGLAATFREVLDLGFRSAKVYRLTAFPGTEVYENLPRSLGGGCPVIAHHGEVLGSKGFPAERNGELARLVHALSVAAALTRTSAALGEGPHLLDRLRCLGAPVLHRLCEALTRDPPEVLLDSFVSLAKELAQALGGDVSEALVEDLANALFNRCLEGRIDRLHYLVGGRVSTVSTVHVFTRGGQGIELDLVRRTIGRKEGLSGDPGTVPPATAIVDLRDHPEGSP